ncbi:hypothetical protein HK098_001644 [Nowakowskiella sp. JEL0407]|nr:hypothetical protein HK098_001644 [Nowakowskiella sp. JEL0407]
MASKAKLLSPVSAAIAVATAGGQSDLIQNSNNEVKSKIAHIQSSIDSLERQFRENFNFKQKTYNPQSVFSETSGPSDSDAYNQDDLIDRAKRDLSSILSAKEKSEQQKVFNSVILIQQSHITLEC